MLILGALWQQMRSSQALTAPKVPGEYALSVQFRRLYPEKPRTPSKPQT
jgi:hypothetical protein